MKDLSGLDDAQLYDVLTALRGPDGGFSYISYAKQEVTARIRSIVFDNKAVICALYNPNPMTLENVAVLNKALVKELEALSEEKNAPADTNFQHYLGHLISALYVVESHEVWAGFGRQLREYLFEVKAYHRAWDRPWRANTLQQKHLWIEHKLRWEAINSFGEQIRGHV